MKKTAQNSEPTAQKIAALPAEKARERKNRIGSIGAGAAQLEGDEGGQQREAAEQRAEHLGARPSPRRCRAPAPRPAPSTPPLTSASPGRSSAESGPWLSGIRASTSGISARPIGTLSQKIHSQAMPSVTAPPTSGPPATARPLTAKKIPSARAAALGREGGADQRQRQRRDRRRAGALHGARGDQRADRRAPARRPPRRATKSPIPATNSAPPAEAVAERRRGHQQHGEAQVVGVDRPLELLDRGAEVAPDRAQRGGHDERVERRHEGRQRGQDEDPFLLGGHAGTDTGRRPRIQR